MGSLVFSLVYLAGKVTFTCADRAPKTASLVAAHLPTMLPIEDTKDGQQPMSSLMISEGLASANAQLVPSSSNLSGSHIISLVEQFETENQLANEIVKHQLARQAQRIANVSDTTDELAEWRETGYKQDARTIADNLASLETRHENLVKQLNYFSREIVSKIPVKHLQDSVGELQESARQQASAIADTRSQQECILKRQDHALRHTVSVEQVRYIQSEVESLSGEFENYIGLVKNLSVMMKSRDGSGDLEHIKKLHDDLNIVRCEVERLAVLVDNRTFTSEQSAGPGAHSQIRRIETIWTRLEQSNSEISKNSMEIRLPTDQVTAVYQKCSLITDEFQRGLSIMNTNHDLVAARIARIEAEMGRSEPDDPSEAPSCAPEVDDTNQRGFNWLTLTSIRNWSSEVIRSNKGKASITVVLILVIGKLIL